MRPGGGFTAGPHSEACRPCRRRRTARPSRPPPAPCRQLIFRFFPLRNMCGQESPPHGHAGAPLPPHASSCARGPASPSRATPPKTTQSQGRYDGIPVPVAAAPFPIPASSHPAGGPLPLYPAIVTADDSLGSSQSRDSRRASTRSGIRGEGPARRPPRPPPSLPLPRDMPAHLPRQGTGGPSRPEPGRSAVPMLADIMRLEPDARGLSPPLPAIFQPAGRLRMPAVPVHPGRSAACPPRLETPSPSSATPRHRRACLLSAASAKAPARAGAIPAPAPSPARTRHPLCAPPARRTPSPLSSRHAPDSAGARVGPAAPPPLRGAARPPSPHAMPACVRQHMTP